MKNFSRPSHKNCLKLVWCMTQVFTLSLVSLVFMFQGSWDIVRKGTSRVFSSRLKVYSNVIRYSGDEVNWRTTSQRRRPPAPAEHHGKIRLLNLRHQLKPPQTTWREDLLLMSSVLSLKILRAISQLSKRRTMLRGHYKSIRLKVA